MNKILIVAMTMAIIMGLASASSQGLGEAASLNSCHCLMFNSTNTTQTWTLVSTYNKSLAFYVVKPNINNVSISTSVTNGVIPANSYYFISVTVVSHSAKNESGDIVAYAGTSNAANSTGGTSLKLGTEKLVKIAANATVVAQIPLQQKSANQSTLGAVASSTTIQNQVAQSTQNKSTAIQGALGGSAASAASPSYLIGAVVILLVAVCILGYYAIKGRNRGEGKRRQSKR
jgi:hypothetical protein